MQLKQQKYTKSNIEGEGKDLILNWTNVAVKSILLGAYEMVQTS